MSNIPQGAAWLLPSGRPGFLNITTRVPGSRDKDVHEVMSRRHNFDGSLPIATEISAQLARLVQEFPERPMKARIDLSGPYAQGSLTDSAGRILIHVTAHEVANADAC